MVAGTGVLKSSGSVKFSEIAAVYGYTTSTTADIKLGDYYKNGTYVKDSLETSIPDKDATPKPSLSVSQLMGRSPRIAKNTTNTYTEIFYNIDTWSADYEARYYILNTPNAINNTATISFYVPSSGSGDQPQTYYVLVKERNEDDYLDANYAYHFGGLVEYGSFSRGNNYTITANPYQTYNIEIYFTHKMSFSEKPIPNVLSAVRNVTPTFKNYY